MEWVTNSVGIRFLDPGKYFSVAAEPPEGAKPVAFSGVIPIDMEHCQGLRDQMNSVIIQVRERLHGAGLTFENVWRITVLCDFSLVGHYDEFNGWYAELLGEEGVNLMPVRTMFRAAGLPKGAFVEFQVDAWRTTPA